MKKIITLCFVVIIAAALLVGCSAAPARMFALLNEMELETPTLRYGVTFKEGFSADKPDGAVVNDTQASSLVLKIERVDNTLARLTTDLTVVYNAVKAGYSGVTDTVHGEVVFVAYKNTAAAMQPRSVTKTAVYGHANDADKGYSYNFDYTTGKGTYRNAAGTARALSVQLSALKGVHDNEQLLILAASALSRVHSGDVTDTPAFQLFNVYEYANGGAAAGEPFTLTMGDNIADIGSVLKKESGETADIPLSGIKVKGGTETAIAQLGASMTANGGAALRMFCTLPTDNTFNAARADGGTPHNWKLPKFCPLGYVQQIRSVTGGLPAQSQLVSEISYALAAKPTL
jgi:hypothetical protein